MTQEHASSTLLYPLSLLVALGEATQKLKAIPGAVDVDSRKTD